MLFVTLYVFPSLTMLFMYSFIVSKLWKRQIPGFRSSRDEIRTRTLRKKVVKMLITVITLFCVCWLPLHVYLFIVYFASDRIPCFDSSMSFYFTSLFLGHAKLAINPYLYALFHRKYREGFKAAWTCSAIIPDDVGFSRTYNRRRSSSNITWLTRSDRSTMIGRRFSTAAISEKRRLSTVTIVEKRRYSTVAIPRTTRNALSRKQGTVTNPVSV